MKELSLNVKTMTLKEITDLLDVRHNEAMKIVEKMAENQEFGNVTKIPYRTNQGNSYETYTLDKRQSVAVSAKLNTALLMRVIDRWQELENGFVVPKTFGEALRLAGELQDKLEAEQAENLKLTHQVEDLTIELDRSKDWFSIKRVAEFNKKSWKAIAWNPLKRHGLEHGLEPYKVFDANFPNGVNVYHRQSFTEVYPSLLLPGDEC